MKNLRSRFFFEIFLHLLGPHALLESKGVQNYSICDWTKCLYLYFCIRIFLLYKKTLIWRKWSHSSMLPVPYKMIMGNICRHVNRNKYLNCNFFFKSLSTVQQSVVPPKPEIIFCGKTASFFGSYFLANMYIMITFKFTAMKFILININCLWVYCDHFLYYNLPKILFPKDVILLFIMTW